VHITRANFGTHQQQPKFLQVNCDKPNYAIKNS